MSAQNFLDPRKFAEQSTSIPHEIGGASALGWGTAVKKGTSDNLVIACDADDHDAFGIIVGPGGNVGTTYAVGKPVQVMPFASGGVIPVVVGTGGAVRGKAAQLAADGFKTAAAAVPGGATAVPLFGHFDMSAAAGELAGLIVARFERIIT